ncbi:MAG: TIGR01777 family oxidoreductase [Candidatus Hinthialibacter antarcticus]|nr:TIGR01777 family oxidoreductase [Candidatus Hinthialibacter antarcticus]
MQTYEANREFPVSVETLFNWHKRPGAFERLAPPWESIRVIEKIGGIENGGRLTFEIKKLGFPVQWTAVHQDYIENQQFCDVQEKGPFKYWKHTHLFEPTPDGSRLTDRVEYELPGGVWGATLGGGFTHSMLERMFRFRHTRTQNDLARHEFFKQERPWKIAISGASGLVGSQLSAFLTTAGHEVHRLVRRAPNREQKEIYWNPQTEKIDEQSLNGFDGIVHLAGEGIASKKWTEEQKLAIRRSRTEGTHLIAEAISRIQNKPRVFVSASATGFYGNRGDELLTEDSSKGKGFLADVCQAWESSANPARDADVRVVHPRIGIVLTPQGGALAKMLPAFQCGVAGPLGDGTMFMSWISLDDLIGVLCTCLFDETLDGAVNAVAPNSVQNKEFTKSLGGVLNRPTLLPAPEFAIKAVLGELGEALLLQSARVAPNRLEATQFKFLHPTLEQALREETAIYS